MRDREDKMSKMEIVKFQREKNKIAEKKNKPDGTNGSLDVAEETVNLTMQ